MAHEDRILRSAYKSSNKATYVQNGIFGGSHRKVGNSMTPYQHSKGKTELPMIGSSGTVGMHTSSHSPEDFDRRYERTQKKWEMVMAKKSNVTEKKNKDMKAMLAKKFKREKAMVEMAKTNEEIKNYNIEERKEKFAEHVKRKHDQDERVDLKKRKELKESMKKALNVEKRRYDILNERRNLNRVTSGIEGNRTAVAPKENSSQVGGTASTHQLGYATQGRARSSTGRKLDYIEEGEDINARLQRYESRMKRASDHRSAHVTVVNKKPPRVNDVDACLAEKYEKIEDQYMKQFEKHVLKRTEIENKVKKQNETAQETREFLLEKKHEKNQQLRQRQEAIKH